MTTVRRCFPLLLLLASVAPPVVNAQEPTGSPGAPPDTAKPRAPTPATAPRLDFSGLMFANYQYRLDRGVIRGQNKFDVDRVYLTFKLPAGDRARIRITTDLFQQQASGNDSFYKGWIVRAKYAYLEYDYLKRNGFMAVARGGFVHNVFIDHDESFWPRWVGTVATDRHGYFSSSDAGVVSLLTFPAKRGELYVTLVNGPGYTSRETDRFKDYAARLTLTPLGGSAASFWRTLALTGWVYKGANGSKFAAGSAEQIEPIGSSLRRDRWGVFAGLKHPRLTLAAQYAARSDEGETGNNTVAAARKVVEVSGNLVSAYAMARLLGASGRSVRPVHLLGRVDQVTSDRSRRDRHRLVVGGLVWDFTPAASLALDYQELLPQQGVSVVPSKTMFLHLVARF